MSFPKLGMYYEDVRKRVLRINRSGKMNENKYRLIDSLKNQAGLAEGDDAKTELQRELDSRLTGKTSSLSGAGSKQVGCCLRLDCTVRGKGCDSCIRFSNYNPSDIEEGSAQP